MLWNVLGSEASASSASFPLNLGKFWASSCLLSSLGLLPLAPHPSLPWLWLWSPTSRPWSDPRELSHNKGGQRYRVSVQGTEKGEPGLKQVGGGFQGPPYFSPLTLNLVFMVAKDSTACGSEKGKQNFWEPLWPCSSRLEAKQVWSRKKIAFSGCMAMRGSCILLSIPED